MTIIDDKGRLFGLINIIDFLVLIFLICLLPMGYFGFKMYKARISPVVESPNTRIDIEFPCRLVNLSPEIAKLISVNDVEVDGDGKPIGTIIELEEIKPLKYKFEIGPDNYAVASEHPYCKERTAKIRLKVEIIGNAIYYKKKQVYLNYPLEFITNKYSLMFMPIADISSSAVMPIKVKVKFPALPPELYNGISEGDVAKGPMGEVICRIEKIISNKPSELPAVNIGENRIVSIQDPYHNDIVAILKLMCTEKNGVPLYKDVPIKIGNRIVFDSSSYVMSGNIIGFEME